MWNKLELKQNIDLNNDDDNKKTAQVTAKVDIEKGQDREKSAVDGFIETQVIITNFRKIISLPLY